MRDAKCIMEELCVRKVKKKKVQFKESFADFPAIEQDNVCARPGRESGQAKASGRDSLAFSYKTLPFIGHKKMSLFI